MDALHEQLQLSSDLHAFTGMEALMCPLNTLRTSPRTEVLLDPDQTAFDNCNCALPWTSKLISDEQTPRIQCTLQPRFHPLANPLLPVPFVNSISYDAEHLGVSLAVFFIPIIIGGMVVFFFTMLSIYQHFGVGQRINASRIPGIVTDVLGNPVLASASAPDLSSGATLVTTPNPITIVVLKLDALSPDGQRHRAHEEGIGRAFDKACEVVLP